MRRIFAAVDASDRSRFDPMLFGMIDGGPYPGKYVAAVHPLPAQSNEKLGEQDNEYRLCAACVEIPENSKLDVHTFSPIDKVTASLRKKRHF